MSFGKAKDHLTRAEVHQIVSTKLGDYGAGYAYDITVERGGEVTDITTGRELRAKAKKGDKATVKVFSRSKSEIGDHLATIKFVFEREALFEGEIDVDRFTVYGNAYAFNQMKRFGFEYEIGKPQPLPDPGVVIVPDFVLTKVEGNHVFDVFCDGRHASKITRSQEGNWTVKGVEGSFTHTFRAVFAALSQARFSV